MSELGTLAHQKDGSYQLRFERHYPHPPEKVWRALIEPAELKHWFPAAIEGERKAGAKLRFVFDGDAGPVTEGVMRVFDPPRVLEFSWTNEVLRFELNPAQDGCKLEFTTTFTERVTAPRDAAGWQKCLDNLADRLGSSPSAGIAWLDLYREYATAFGPSDYPSFVKRAGIVVRDAMQTRGLDGHAFQGHGASRVELLRASNDAETPAHPAAPNEYLLVLEGRYELQLGGGQIVLERGMEFAFPPGFSITGKISAGTRVLRAVSDSPPK
jgi:uncharacterized protein YndB with AHSA1/START domain/mannose-6-phosphate isomerase-like protein (cupin superfamily)